MPFTSVSQLIPVLQTSIGPVILISGVGLLLLSMTNRLGRVIDRSRILVRELRDTGEAEGAPIRSQLEILVKRGRLIQLAIGLASVSVLLASILVIVLFLTALFHLEDAWLITALFIGCMLALIFSLIAFIRDINLSLVALHLELGDSQRRS